MQHAEQELIKIIRETTSKERRRTLYQAVLVAIVAGTSIGAWETSRAILGAVTQPAAHTLVLQTSPALPSQAGGTP